MSTLVAVDPGTQEAGLAIFQDRVLTGAWVIKAEGTSADARVINVVDQLERLIRTQAPKTQPTGGIIEMPQVYRQGPGMKADPADLLLLTLVVGGIMCRLPELGWRRPHPADWKGQVPKAVMTKRILGRLTPAERERAGTNHNAIDAVGLGAWALSRLA